MNIHLVAVPWAHYLTPSTAFGAIKTHIDRVFAGKNVLCRTYSAHTHIYAQVLVWLGKNLVDRQSIAARPRELYYLYLLLQEHYKETFFKTADGFLINNIKNGLLDVEEKELGYLGGITRNYIKKEVVCNIDGGINILGFSLTYDQLYSSIYFIKTIEALRPGERFIYIFGGDSVTDINAIRMLQKFGISGWCFVGQGEKKLEYFLRLIMEHEDDYESFLINTSFPKEAGFFSIDNPPDDLDHLSPKYFARDIVNRDEISVPDYSEFYSMVERLYDSSLKEFENWLSSVPLEVSRGCYGNCNFCNKGNQSVLYLCKSDQNVVDFCLSAAATYKVACLDFVDNVCGWAIEFARYLYKNSLRYSLFMALRVGYSEEQYTLLALAGLRKVTFGIESFSQKLLHEMNKQTLVIENLKALKYIAELGITTSSLIITSHPSSTLEDVAITKNILKKIPHFPKVLPGGFVYLINSPAYKGLTRQQKASLIPLIRPQGLDEYFFSSSYLLPEEHMPEGWDKIRRAWEEFDQWYDTIIPDKNYINCTSMGRDRVLIEYGVYEEYKRIILEGVNAKVFNEAHGGVTAEAMAKKMNINIDEVSASLKYLVEESIVLDVDGYFLALALRKRDVLVKNFFRKYPKVEDV